MEDMYVKPGNQERGWNDPPQFSYGLQMARGPQRNLLNKRPVPPTTSVSGVPPTAPPSSNAPPPLMCGIAPPPILSADKVAPPPPDQKPVRNQTEATNSQSEPDVEAVMSVLTRALGACRHSVEDQVCKEVAKRLRLLEDNWRAGKLSLPVRRRMDTLSLELQSGHWDSADEVHRSLMVDHVTEVSQWMVGVKRLIAETQNLSPELLKPLQSSRPFQKATESFDDSTKPVQDHMEPVHESTKSVQDPAEPVQDTKTSP